MLSSEARDSGAGGARGAHRRRHLQKFFFDVPLSATVTPRSGLDGAQPLPRRVGSRHAPGTRGVDRKLQLNAHRAVQYFAAVRAMYGYLDQKHGRAAEMFKALFRDDEDTKPILLTD